MRILTYYHTLKYLKFSQVYYRILKRFVRPKPRNLIGKPTHLVGSWIKQYLYEQKIFDDYRFQFLNKSGEIKHRDDWNDASHTKLWIYNLHYFDDLNAFDAETRRRRQVALIHKWINENPAPQGNGWEPYPISLRIVNWTKAFLSGIEPDATMLNSLAQQADFLSQNIEFHLLGNHLFANAKALIFAGLYFESNDADKWLEIGLSIYVKELKEQVLSDGGNFELTPMYHMIMLVDLLDLINIFTAYPGKIEQKEISKNIIDQTKNVFYKMFRWLDIMSHNDGEISFFNDSCYGIAPKNGIVLEYALKLGLNVSPISFPSSEILELYNLQHSGYVVVKTNEYSLIADLAAIGADYIPGHAHADSLSFELVLDKQRIFVNSGISEYGLTDERLRQRKTPAHNTVSVNDLDSSQVWSGFRVAKRANIENRIINFENKKNQAKFGASHDGFRKQGINCTHHRNWQVTKNSIIVTDKLEGTFKKAKSYLHCHPDIEILEFGNKNIILKAPNYEINLLVTGAIINVENATWHPEFGISLASYKLCFLFTKDMMSIKIQWCKM